MGYYFLYWAKYKMEHFLGHKEQFWGQKDQGPPKRSQAMPHDVFCPQKK
jgi:hypothetical protein